MTERGDMHGRSKGCGIVEFEEAADAARAIAELNDTDMNGRLIMVREVSRLTKEKE